MDMENDPEVYTMAEMLKEGYASVEAPILVQAFPIRVNEENGNLEVLGPPAIVGAYSNPVFAIVGASSWCVLAREVSDIDVALAFNPLVTDWTFAPERPCPQIQEAKDFVSYYLHHLRDAAAEEEE